METIRMCVACRAHAARHELLRVVQKDGLVLFDEKRSLPGRGAWIHNKRACVSKAVSRNMFARALRVPGKPDTTLLENRLEKIMDN